MIRAATQVDLGDGRERRTVRLSDRPTPAGGPGHRAGLIQLLETLVNTPDLLMCGDQLAQTLNIKYDGGRWLVVVESIVQR